MKYEHLNVSQILLVHMLQSMLQDPIRYLANIRRLEGRVPGHKVIINTKWCQKLGGYPVGFWVQLLYMIFSIITNRNAILSRRSPTVISFAYEAFEKLVATYLPTLQIIKTRLGFANIHFAFKESKLLNFSTANASLYALKRWEIMYFFACFFGN